MARRTTAAFGAALALASCGAPEHDPTPSETASATVPTPKASATSAAPEPTRTARAGNGTLDATLIRSEWRKAANRVACAPLAFTDTGGQRGVARRANFSGGWAVAYDLPGLRSAYGVAGTGLIAEQDSQPPAAQRARLRDQWPYFVELGKLPQPAFAGYGIEGAEAYPASNLDGTGVNSLAYLRIGGQACTYNVWSRLGRAHLERLLAGLTVIAP